MTRKEHDEFACDLFKERGKCPPNELFLDRLWKGLDLSRSWPIEDFKALARTHLPAFEKAVRAINN